MKQKANQKIKSHSGYDGQVKQKCLRRCLHIASDGADVTSRPNNATLWLYCRYLQIGTR